MIQTGTIAAVAVAFAKYCGVFFPWISTSNNLIRIGIVDPDKLVLRLTTQQFVAIALIVFLTWSNTRGIRTGAVVQNVFTFAKVAALLGLIGFGFLLGRNPAAVAQNFTHFWRGADWSFTTFRIVGVAMVGALFSSDAWNNVTFTAGEVRNPRRNLPLSLALGVGVVSALYIASNFVYLNVLTLDEIQTAAEDRVATAAAQDARTGRGSVDGSRHHDLHLRLHQRNHPLRRPRLLRHGQGQTVLPPGRPPGSRASCAPVRLDRCSASGPCC